MNKHFLFMAVCLSAIATHAQNVGVGTSNPLNKLHVAGGMRLDTLTGVNGNGIVTHNANGVIYGLKFSGNVNDVLLGNGTFGAVPGGGGGTSFWSANGTHIYNNNTGNVGVGITTPQTKFHVSGTSWFTGDNTPLPPEAGKGVAIGQLGENGYVFAFDYTSFTPRNLLLNNPGGNVGIGTLAPSFTLDIRTPTFGGGTRTISNGAANFVVQTDGGTNSWARYYMKSTNRSWSIGTSQNFNGDQLYINDETAGQTRMVINTVGNVGIGTTNPLVKLHVNGTGIVESSVQSTNERAILSLNSSIGGQNRVWTLENGVFGNPGQFAIYDRTAGQARISIQPGGPTNVQGNTTQDLGGYGLPKAMLYIQSNGFNSAQIIRCYNGLSGGTTNGCGFSVTFNSSNRTFAINMGFSIDNRFISITPVDVGGSEQNIKRQVYVANNTGGNLIYIHAEHIDDDGSTFIEDEPIAMMVIIY